MIIIGRNTDKLLFVMIYVAVAVIVVMASGRAITNYALDAALYHSYLRVWEERLTQMRLINIAWPEYDRQDPVGYMQVMVSRMQRAGVHAPESNTDRPYFYRLRRFGERPIQLLLVCTQKKIILFNLPEATFRRMDRFIDGKSTPQSGRFTGVSSADQHTRIAVWEV